MKMFLVLLNDGAEDTVARDALAAHLATQWRATRILQQGWIITGAANARGLRDDLRPHVPSGAGLIVSRLKGDVAWTGRLPVDDAALEELFDR